MSERVPTVRGSALRLTIFAVVASLIAVLLFNTLTNSVGRSTSAYTAMFDDASGLHAGDNVRVAGVRVGRVDGVSLDGNTAKVRFTVAKTQPLLRTTTVVIRYQNLIGQRYLALLPGATSSEVLPPGSLIPQTNTEDALDLTVVINGFQPLFDVISPADINRLSTSVVSVLQGEGGSLVNLLRTASDLSAHLADRDEVIGRVISNFAAVLTDVGQRDHQVDDLIAQLHQLVRAAAGDRDQIGGSIEALAGLTTATASLLRDIRPQLKADLTRLERVSAEFARQKGPFGQAVAGLPPALAAFARTMQYGSWTNLYLCNVYFATPDGKSQQFGDTGANSAVCS
jgi:phospholipid/cholesterol/gamma-HCH transport system substrate-binding protein